MSNHKLESQKRNRDEAVRLTIAEMGDQQVRLIPEFPRYYALSNGAMLDSKRLLCALGSLNDKGYAYAPIGNGMHRWIAKMFIPNPENYPHVNHLDGNPLNNRVKNLQWCTRSMNMRHSVDVLGKEVGENHHNAKLKEKDVHYICDQFMVLGLDALPDLMKKYKISHSCLKNIWSGAKWKKVVRQYVSTNFRDQSLGRRVRVYPKKGEGKP